MGYLPLPLWLTSPHSCPLLSNRPHPEPSPKCQEAWRASNKRGKLGRRGELLAGASKQQSIPELRSPDSLQEDASLRDRGLKFFPLHLMFPWRNPGLATQREKTMLRATAPSPGLVDSPSPPPSAKHHIPGLFVSPAGIGRAELINLTETWERGTQTRSRSL